MTTPIITIEFRGKRVEMTLKEAREVFVQLEKIFAEKSCKPLDNLDNWPKRPRREPPLRPWSPPTIFPPAPYRPKNLPWDDMYCSVDESLPARIG